MTNTEKRDVKYEKVTKSNLLRWENDPLGYAIEDYYRGNKEGTMIVRCSIAEEDTLPAAYMFRDETGLPEQDKVALDHCKGKVLDIGAGSGMHTLMLQERGFEVTAIDISPGAVMVMEKRGVKDARHLQWEKLPEENQFNTLLMLMNGIGVVETIAGLESFFEKAKGVLARDGIILADSIDITYLYEDDEGYFTLKEGQDYYGEVKYQIEYKHIVGEEFPWLFIGFENLAYIAEKHGFGAELLYHNEQGNFLAKMYRKT